MTRIHYLLPDYVAHIPPLGSLTLVVGTSQTDTGGREIGDIFNFRSNSLELIVLDASVLDRETIDQYIFTVVATDATGLSSTANVIINILDFNDEAPVITNDG